MSLLLYITNLALLLDHLLDSDNQVNLTLKQVSQVCSITPGRSSEYTTIWYIRIDKQVSPSCISTSSQLTVKGILSVHGQVHCTYASCRLFLLYPICLSLVEIIYILGFLLPCVFIFFSVFFQMIASDYLEDWRKLGN